MEDTTCFSSVESQLLATDCLMFSELDAASEKLRLHAAEAGGILLLIGSTGYRKKFRLHDAKSVWYLIIFTASAVWGIQPGFLADVHRRDLNDPQTAVGIL